MSSGKAKCKSRFTRRRPPCLRCGKPQNCGSNRGLCRSCYGSLAKLVSRRVLTWESVERMGLSKKSFWEKGAATACPEKENTYLEK